MSRGELRGCGTALVTPFKHDGDVDETRYRALIDWQIEQGVDFLVPCGSTGEAATLSVEEHVRVVAVCAEQVDGRVPVVAGAGGNDTKKAIALSHAVAEAGATHVMHVSPAYSRPPQRGIVAHFTAVADAAPRPVLLYNVPGRTASNVEATTTLALSEHPNVVGVKEASGSLVQISEILRHRPAGFTVLSGDDALTVAVMALGGDGIVSVVSNALPRLMTDLTHAADRGDQGEARRIHFLMAPFMSAAFVESNPIPIKAALGLMGRIDPTVRLPLVPLAETHHQTVRAALAHAGVALS
jgi:4-hydroxy-tetrahydrodipicolinate synthase